MPVDLCTNSMITEFISSEELGGAGSVGQAFQAVAGRYQHDLTPEQDRVLRSIAVARKIGLQSQDRPDCLQALATFCGATVDFGDAHCELISKQEKFEALTR